jgi:hypothetical protein
MARRAGTTPFSLTTVNADGHRPSPARSHSHTQTQSSMQPQGNMPPQASMPREMMAPHSPHSMYARPQPVPVPMPPANRVAVPRRDQLHGPPPPPPPPAMVTEHTDMYYTSGPGLPPIQNQPQPRSAGLLPGVAELTTGVSPYSPAPGGPSGAPMAPPLMGQAGNYPPGIGYGNMEVVGSKRRASPEMSRHEMSNKRRME